MPAKLQKFRALIEKGDRALGWTIVRVPFDPSTAWPNMIRLRVKGEMEGHPFRTSFFPDPHGGFFLLVTKALQAATGLRPGSMASFQIEPDLDPREAHLPDELAALLQDEPGLMEWYESLTEYTRREIGKWIGAVKSDDARIRRAEQMAERLLATMEAERELPPIFQAAFRGRPKARTGWQKMTSTQRRHELMAVFYYQTPEARQRRLEKTLNLAESKAG